jgi:hypothetical protein
MKKLSVAVVFLVFLAFVLPRTYGYWPSSKAQDYAIIWLKGEKIVRLFELAELNGYKRAFVCPDKPHNIVIFESGESLDDWETDSTFKTFSNAVLESDLPCFQGQKNDGTWYIDGSNDLKITGSNENRIRHDISRHYFFSEGSLEPMCKEATKDIFSLKACTYKIFGNWFMYEEILSRPFQEYSDET